jgi:hypothetical protein
MYSQDWADETCSEYYLLVLNLHPKATSLTENKKTLSPSQRLRGIRNYMLSYSACLSAFSTGVGSGVFWRKNSHGIEPICAKTILVAGCFS